MSTVSQSFPSCFNEVRTAATSPCDIIATWRSHQTGVSLVGALPVNSGGSAFLRPS